MKVDVTYEIVKMGQLDFITEPIKSIATSPVLFASFRSKNLQIESCELKDLEFTVVLTQLTEETGLEGSLFCPSVYPT